MAAKTRYTLTLCRDGQPVPAATGVVRDVESDAEGPHDFALDKAARVMMLHASVDPCDGGTYTLRWRPADADGPDSILTLWAPEPRTEQPISDEYVLGCNQEVRAGDSPTVILSVARDNTTGERGTVVLTVGEASVQPPADRGAVRNVREIRITDGEADMLLDSLLRNSWGEASKRHDRLWMSLCGGADFGAMPSSVRDWFRYHAELARQRSKHEPSYIDDVDRLARHAARLREQIAAQAS